MFESIFGHVMEQIAREIADVERKRSLAAKRPFDSGRTMPRDEGLERAVKRMTALECGKR